MAAKPYPCVTLYGEMRTCTNYVRHLLVENLAVTVLVNTLGWKHAPPPPHIVEWLKETAHSSVAKPTRWGPLVGAVVCTKNPYAWLASFLNHLEGGVTRDSAGKGSTDLMIGDERTAAVLEAVTRTKDGLRTDPAFAATCCEWYNENHRAWVAMLRAAGTRGTFVRYADLLKDWQGFLARIAEQWGLERKADSFTQIEGTALSTGKVAKARFTRQDYYLSGAYMKRLSPQVRRIVTKTIDWDMLEYYGYKPEGAAAQ